MDQIFLSSTLSFLLANSISNRWLSLLEREKYLNPSFALFFIETLQNLDWKIHVRGKDGVVSERTTAEVGKVVKLCSGGWETQMPDAYILLSPFILQWSGTEIP